jgi:hypothetical protein
MMRRMQRFRALLWPVPHGGHDVVVPPAVADAAGIKHHSRVRGTCNGVAYRSSTPIYSGAYHLGLHKAMLEQAGAALRPSHKREHVKAILEAKKPETRAARADKAIAMLRAAKKA